MKKVCFACGRKLGKNPRRADTMKNLAFPSAKINGMYREPLTEVFTGHIPEGYTLSFEDDNHVYIAEVKHETK